MAQLMGGGPKGGPTNDMNSMLTNLGMSGMVGQDQQGMQQAVQQIPGGLVAPPLSQQPARTPGEYDLALGQMMGGAPSRPGGNSIMELLRQMSAGGPMGF